MSEVLRPNIGDIEEIGGVSLEVSSHSIVEEGGELSPEEGKEVEDNDNPLMAMMRSSKTRAISREGHGNVHVDEQWMMRLAIEARVARRGLPLRLRV